MIKNLLTRWLSLCTVVRVATVASHFCEKTMGQKYQMVAVVAREVMSISKHLLDCRICMTWEELISREIMESLAKAIKVTGRMLRISSTRSHSAQRSMKLKCNSSQAIWPRVKAIKYVSRWPTWKTKMMCIVWQEVAQVAQATCRINHWRYCKKVKKAKRNNLNWGWSW